MHEPGKEMGNPEIHSEGDVVYGNRSPDNAVV
jgi:hypothetical protein